MTKEREAEARSQRPPASEQSEKWRELGIAMISATKSQTFTTWAQMDAVRRTAQALIAAADAYDQLNQHTYNLAIENVKLAARSRMPESDNAKLYELLERARIELGPSELRDAEHDELVATIDAELEKKP